jgi:hypothetical protein
VASRVTGKANILDYVGNRRETEEFQKSGRTDGQSQRDFDYGRVVATELLPQGHLLPVSAKEKTGSWVVQLRLYITLQLRG